MINNKAKEIKDRLRSIGCFAIIVPSNDPHFGEYVQPFYNVRSWYSGFNGSAGTLVITTDSDALWTDSRYFIQAQEQMKESDVELMKQNTEGTLSIPNWIKKELETNLLSSSNTQCSSNTQGSANKQCSSNSLSSSKSNSVFGCTKIAIDKSLFSYQEYLSLAAELAPYELELIDDIFSYVWEERPQLHFNRVEAMPLEYAGESTANKYSRVLERLGVNSINKAINDNNCSTPFVYPIAACDEIAWLCNIRGTDISYNPVAQSFAVITHTGIELFINLQSISLEVRSELESNGVILHSYNSYEEYLKSIPANYIRYYSPSKITVRDYMALNVTGATFKQDTKAGGVVNYLKSIKNSVELEGFKRSFTLDSIVWATFLEYIESLISSGAEFTEYDLEVKLIELRERCYLYRGESFTPIIAFGASAALPHYHSTKESANIIGRDNFLLMDLGAQYICGTTDTTRTIPIGKLTPKQIKAYTLVLKGMINLSTAKFPANTRGSQLDILARGPLFNEGWMYFHGTCHGIGHYLCVHEGPQSVRIEENPVTLAPGMVISNEPAIYFNGEFGIRTENVIAVKEWQKSEFNNFYEFETLTLVPICTSCIDKSLLTTKEIEWLNNYNAKVYREVSQLVEPKVAEWLATECKPINS